MRRTLGILLIAYGLLGCLGFAAVAILADAPLRELTDTADRLDQQRVLLADSLRTTASTLDDAANGLAGFDASIEQARGSSDRAADLSRDVAATMAQMGATMRSITILNIRILESLAPGFERADEQLRQLGNDLDAMGASLSTNADDAQRTREGIEELQGRIEQLAVTVEETSLTGMRGDAFEQLRLALALMIGWFALLAVGSVLLGLYLVSGRPRARD